MVQDNLEETSGIDNENYVIIREENVVDGIAEFIAKCIHENPKSKVNRERLCFCDFNLSIPLLYLIRCGCKFSVVNTGATAEK